MKNRELFDKTIAILVRAYQNDTLLHGSCASCAVGNIVASSMNIKVDPDCVFKWITFGPMWQNVFLTANSVSYKYPENYQEIAKYQIDSTGYSWQELAKIESAFESVAIPSDGPFYNSDSHVFEGLMGVVDALMEIHEANEEEVLDAKSMFVKA